MAFVSLRQVLDHAAEHGYGVPAFNVNNLEQVQAIMEAAQATDSPVILQASAGARKYAGEAYLRHIMLAAVEAHPDIPVVVHQDHGTSPAVCQQSIRSGFTSVMMDGSLGEDGKTPSSYDYNVEVTRRVCEMAHAVGVSVEGELGCLGSLETGEAGEEDGIGAAGKLSHDMLLTDPMQSVHRPEPAFKKARCPIRPSLPTAVLTRPNSFAMFSLSSKMSFRTSAIFPARPIWLTGSRTAKSPFLNAIRVAKT